MEEEYKKLQDIVTAWVWDIKDWNKGEYRSPYAKELQLITLNTCISTELFPR